jgi:hypothetical protein
MNFQTDKIYVNRQQKFAYVWDKYSSILTNSILDVGADERHLKKYLADETTYWGVGLGGSPDQAVDLEQGHLPFEDNSYDCVLCLDVLEHLASAHQVFDELCRVSRKYVIISLPNSWRSLLLSALFEPSKNGIQLKYYGIPVESPVDRHKWFMSYQEAADFVQGRASLNQLKTVQIDDHNALGAGKKAILRLFLNLILRFDQRKIDLFMKGTMWAVIEKEGGA